MPPNDNYNQQTDLNDPVTEPMRTADNLPVAEEVVDNTPQKNYRKKDNSGKWAGIVVILLTILMGIIFSNPNVFRVQIPDLGSSSSVQSSRTSTSSFTEYFSDSPKSTSPALTSPSFSDWIRILVACVIATALFTILTAFIAISMNAKMSAMVEIAKDIRDTSDNTTPRA